MSSVTCQLSVSLDGFVAGPDQSLADPLGKGGMRLHEWFFGPQDGDGADHRDPVDVAIGEQVLQGIGAFVMGRRMFGGGDGSWDPAWRGWWGEDPPFHAPVFVLSHHPREPLAMQGGTTFTFVTSGIEAALEQARGPRRRSPTSGTASAATRAVGSPPRRLSPLLRMAAPTGAGRLR